MTWKPTVEEVAALTTKTVSEATITAALGTIELFTGELEAVTRVDLKARDAHFLKVAVAYQAAWLADQVDAFTHSTTTSLSQDGESVVFARDGKTLAPYARHAIKRLSWKGTRSITVKGVTERKATFVDDDALPWRPL